MSWTRRRALKAGFGASLLAATSPLAACGGANTADLSATPLADDLVMISGAGGNAVAAGASDGIVLVDGGSAERAKDLIAFARRRVGGGQIRTLINTHWHWDQTGANEILGPQGARILAHENTKLWMGAHFPVPWMGRVHTPSPAEALPNDTFFGDKTVEIGGRSFEFGYMLQAHTDGDVFVHLPAENVLIASDVVAKGAYPIIDDATGGWLAGMADGLLRILETADDDTKIVPGLGPVLTKADVQAQYDMVTTMLERVIQGLREGKGAQDMLAASITGEFDAAWGDPTVFVTNAYRSMLGHLREVNGIVA
jgi:glyoxylase-like metal-dependent hydrolase (beta-lactamase superfamily II)